MRIVIEDKDFRRLSPATRKELLAHLAGKQEAAPCSPAEPESFQAARPMDLTPDLVAKLIHGLAENHRGRLEVFARNDGRASMKQLLAVTRDKDLRVLSYFQGAVTRKLRRLVDMPEAKVNLLGWDYDSTKWNKSHTAIVDGDYFVTRTTATSLRKYFDL